MEERTTGDLGRATPLALGGMHGGAWPAAHLRRQRLVDAVLASPVSWLLAPSGYGKTRLVSDVTASLGHAFVFVELAAVPQAGAQLRSAIHQGLRREGLGGVAEALEPHATPETDGEAFVAELARQLAERSDPVAIVIEEIGLAIADAPLVASLARAVRAPHRLILTGRGFELPARTPGVALDGADLAFTSAEARALADELGVALDARTADRLVEATAGWPAAVAIALQSDRLDPGSLRHGLEPLVEAVLADLPDSVREAATTLAHLPLLSPRVARAIVPGVAFEALTATGLLGRPRPDGWIAMAEPVRDAIRQRGRLPQAQARTAARELLVAGQAPAAIALLLAWGDLDGLADALAERSWRELQAIGVAELRAVLDVLPPGAIERRPGLGLALARVAESAVELEWRHDLLAAVGRAAGAGDDPSLRAALLAEQASDAAMHGRVDDALALATRSLAAGATRGGRGDLVARARARWAEGRALAFSREPAGMAQASTRLREAAFLFAATDEPELRAQALTTLGYGLHFAEGELDAAVAALREAAEVPASGARQRAATLTFLADALLYAGALEDAEAALREVVELARRLHDQRLLGYHAWMAAGVASRRGDGEAVLGWLVEAERHPGDWFEHPTGIEFLADAVDHLGRVGDEANAEQYLARVAARCASDSRPEVDQIELGARALHEARFGDPVLAERDLVALLEAQQLPRRESWRVALLRAFAALRAGDVAAAERHARRAAHGAAVLGHPELPSVHEAVVTRALEAALPAAAWPTPAAAGAAAQPIAVSVLGGFAVRAPGETLLPPPGRPELLVKLLAVRGPAAAEEAIEVLWPEVDEETGRARLRNVLSRLRSSCGPLVVRDGAAVRLGDGVSVDAVEFEHAAREALAADAASADGRLRGALARHAGELLPTDRYVDFAAAPRERIAGLHVALLDRLATSAAASGDVDEALRRYDEAIAAAPLDEHRYEAAARLALERGRRRRAAGYIDRLRTVLAELDVALPARLGELQAAAGATGQPEVVAG